ARRAPMTVAERGWHLAPERGGARLLRTAAWAMLGAGWTVGSLLLWPITLWFLATARPARAASRDYLARVLGRRARMAEVAAHFHTFAATVLDRLYLLAGRGRALVLRTEGLEVLTGIVGRGEGCVLLGAHLGSFEVLRAVGAASPVPVRALMWRRNAGALTGLFDRLAPGLRDEVIEIGEPSSMLRVQECLAGGGVVGILADRAPDGQRMVAVPFLGAPARFPAGPFILAAALHVPVVLFRAVRTGRRRYAVTFEPFAERIVLRRGAREEDIRAWVARYADALAVACRAHPFNWFNFYRFWDDADDAAPPPPGDAAGDLRGVRPGAPGGGGGEPAP
ncbi:LpxL/LpxP family acyltransferase, partial [Acidisphaera rubrifaciens]